MSEQAECAHENVIEKSVPDPRETNRAQRQVRRICTNCGQILETRVG